MGAGHGPKEGGAPGTAPPPADRASGVTLSLARLTAAELPPGVGEGVAAGVAEALEALEESALLMRLATRDRTGGAGGSSAASSPAAAAAAAAAGTAGGGDSTLAAAAREHYSAVREFAAAQLDGEAARADLATNTRGGDAARAAALLRQYEGAQALLMAGLAPEVEAAAPAQPRLTPAVLIETHRKLTTVTASAQPGPHPPGPQPGLRKGGVRAGTAHFPAASEVPRALETFCATLNAAIERLAASPEPREGLQWATWTLYWLNVIHPWNDGNGRVARIVLNYVLRRCAGVPFTVHVCASVEQRAELVAALREEQQDRGTGSRLEKLQSVVAAAVLRGFREVGGEYGVCGSEWCSHEDDQSTKSVPYRAQPILRLSAVFGARSRGHGAHTCVHTYACRFIHIRNPCPL